jgi:hypothetical protein
LSGVQIVSETETFQVGKWDRRLRSVCFIDYQAGGIEREFLYDTQSERLRSSVRRCVNIQISALYGHHSHREYAQEQVEACNF